MVIVYIKLFGVSGPYFQVTNLLCGLTYLHIDSYKITSIFTSNVNLFCFMSEKDHFSSTTLVR